MIRAIFIFFAGAWFLLLFLKRARKSSFREVFAVPRWVVPLVLVASAVLASMFLVSFAPYVGDPPYFFGSSNAVMYVGEWPRNDGHELSLAAVVGVRYLVEQIFHLPLSFSIIAITFSFSLLYAFSIFRFVAAGTGCRSLALLASVAVPFSFFTFWFLAFNVWAQFLSLNMFLLAVSCYFKRDPLWKTTLLLSLAVVFHVWSGVLYGVIFGVFLVLSQATGLGKMSELKKIVPKVWFLPLLLLVAFQHWHVFLEREFDPLISNPVFLAGFPESPLVVVLAVVGLVFLSQRKSKFSVLMFSWVIFCSFALFFHSSVWVSRILFILPLPVFVAAGTHHAASKLRGRRMRALAVFSLIFAVVATSFMVSAGYASGTMNGRKVSLTEADAIQAVVGKYGYRNKGVLLVVEIPHDDIRTWAEYLTGMEVWYGNIKKFNPSEFSGRKIVFLELRK